MLRDTFVMHSSELKGFKFNELDSFRLFRLVSRTVDKCEECNMFDYLIHSKRKQSRKNFPFIERTLFTMNRLKNDILSDLSKVQEYQFMSLCKLLSSEPFMLIFKDLWKADDLKSLFTLLKKFLPQLFKNFSQNTDLREKRLLQTSMSDILKAIKNIKEHLPDKLDSSNIELLNESGKDILYKLKSQGDIKGAIKNAELEYEERVIAISCIESIENSSKARTLFKMFLQNIASHNI